MRQDFREKPNPFEVSSNDKTKTFEDKIETTSGDNCFKFLTEDFLDNEQGKHGLKNGKHV